MVIGALSVRILEYHLEPYADDPLVIHVVLNVNKRRKFKGPQ
jgi:hypothetical protein